VRQLRAIVWVHPHLDDNAAGIALALAFIGLSLGCGLGLAHAANGPTEAMSLPVESKTGPSFVLRLAYQP
jgi:hypothetical protein